MQALSTELTHRFSSAISLPSSITPHTPVMGGVGAQFGSSLGLRFPTEPRIGVTVDHMKPVDEGRRGFLKGLAGLHVIAADAVAEPQAPPRKPELFNAIQMGPHTMLDEGIERLPGPHPGDRGHQCAHDLQPHLSRRHSQAAAVACNGSWCTAARDAQSQIARRVGRAPRAVLQGHDSCATRVPDRSYEYAGRDLFEEVQEPARKRGMKVYARILEGASANSFRASPRWSPRDVYGKAHAGRLLESSGIPRLVECHGRRHVPDLPTLDGLAVGRRAHGSADERHFVPGTTSRQRASASTAWPGARPTGIDAERARKGFEELYNYVQARCEGNSPKTRRRHFHRLSA